MAAQVVTSSIVKPSDRAWWKSATVYQIYPASFCDHGSSGHGTLKGILSKVPYLHSLGVDIIWLSPIYASPQADMGYDISDYRSIDPRYGRLEDWNAILDKTHGLGMKLVMDLVVNHTSEEHAWFKESRSSKDNPKRDWYIWRPPRYDAEGQRLPPNNWKPIFGDGSAWEYDETTNEYYLHLFLKEQPDLNWESPQLRNEVYDMMHWWLKKGVDGFRMDVINFISKASGLPDAPIVRPDREYQPFGSLSINRPKVHEYMQEMNEKVLSHYDCFAVGECPGNEAVAKYAPYSIQSNKELQMVFHFHHQSFDRGGDGLGRSYNPDWKLSEMKKVFNEWQVEMEAEGGWNSNYLENHDQPRIVSRLASDHPDDRTKCAKLTAMFHASLTGTLFIYQGEEIGMINVPKSWGEEEYKDIETIQYLQGERAYLQRKTGEKEPDVTDILRTMRQTARDNGRTPIQWDDSHNAGFSKGEPWMRVHDDYKQWNVAAQMNDDQSPWSFWRQLLKVRKDNEALIYGRFIPLAESDEAIYAYIRHDIQTNQALLVVLNFAKGDDGRGAKAHFTPPSSVDLRGNRLVIGNRAWRVGQEVEMQNGAIELDKWEGLIVELHGAPGL